MKSTNRLSGEKSYICEIESHRHGGHAIENKKYLPTWPNGSPEHEMRLELIDHGIRRGRIVYYETGKLPEKIVVSRRGLITSVAVYA